MPLTLENHSNEHHDFSKCEILSCGACPSLVQLEDEIQLCRKRLCELVAQRKSFTNAVNNIHDPFSRIPTELVSEIFKSYREERPYDNKMPLVIGSVCKRWRDVTLGTAQLWSIVCIYPDINKPYDLNVATEWLSRSRTMPLSFSIEIWPHRFNNENRLGYPGRDNTDSFMPLIELLKSHSIRWREIIIDDVPYDSELIPSLFTNLEKMPSNLERLNLRHFQTSLDDHRVVSKYDPDQLLCPKILHLDYESSGAVGLRLGWQRLTSLIYFECDVYLEELLHIIKNSPSLTSCTVLRGSLITMDLVESPDENEFELPEVPIISHSLTNLDLDSVKDGSDSLLGFLTLPSLEGLRYEYYRTWPDDPGFYVLQEFLKRSSPPLKSVDLTITPSDANDIRLWPGKDIPITSLALDLSYMEDLQDDCDTAMTNFFDLLGQALDDERLPKLQILELIVYDPSHGFWSTLSNFLLRFTGSDARSLQKVMINDESFNECMTPPRVDIDGSVYSRFIEMQKSGIEVVLGSRIAPQYPLSEVVNTFPQL